MFQSSNDSSYQSLFPNDASLRCIETGFGFTEGPIWHPEEKWLIFSDIARSIQWRWSEATGFSIFRRPSNQANGNCFDCRGRVITCEHATSQVIRHDHDGKLVQPIATSYAGKSLNSPNDVICDALGRIWFSDPSFGRILPELGIIRNEEQDIRGVYRLDPNGTLTRVISDMEQPNGLCFSLDGQRLFVNDTAKMHIRVWDVGQEALSGGAVWTQVKGALPGVVDGMKVTRSGELLVTGPGGVLVFSGAFGNDPHLLGVIHVPENCTNFCFGGEQLQTLFITTHTSLYSLETTMRGLPMINGFA